MLLEVLGLFENFFVDLITVHTWIVLLSKQYNKINLQFGLDAVELDPVGEFRLFVDHGLHLLCELDQFVLGILDVDNSFAYGIPDASKYSAMGS